MAIALVVAAALGGAGGLVAGFVAAVVTLAARRGRNARLVARGEAPYKDAILPRAFIGFGAVAGAIVSPLAALWLPTATAVALGASAIPALLVVVALVFALTR
jgi:hypothetical protein